MLIRDLKIQGYRCFEDFSMDGLTRVNLLVGNNNSGKTSFLEAVYLLVNQPISLEQKPTLFEILENRGEFRHIILPDPLKPQSLEANKLTLQYIFDYICYRENNIFIDGGKFQSVTIKTEKERKMILSLGISEQLSYFTFNDPYKLNVWEYTLKYDSEKYVNLHIHGKNSMNTFDDRKKEFFHIDHFIEIDPYPVAFQSTYTINNENIFKLWDRINLTSNSTLD
jgi:AAA15 family ATPase/GTPase